MVKPIGYIVPIAIVGAVVPQAAEAQDGWQGMTPAEYGVMRDMEGSVVGDNGLGGLEHRVTPGMGLNLDGSEARFNLGLMAGDGYNFKLVPQAGLRFDGDRFTYTVPGSLQWVPGDGLYANDGQRVENGGQLVAYGTLGALAVWAATQQDDQSAPEDGAFDETF